MGIRRLTTRLMHKGEKVSLGSIPDHSAGQQHQIRSAKPYEGSVAIIDGPSLAHYVYYMCQKSNVKSGHSPFDNSYASFVRCVVEWLDDLRTLGFEVSYIFFDGVLPASKLQTRISRLEGYTRQVAVFRASYDEYVKRSKSKIRLNDYIRRSTQALHLPPPAFLVVVAIEALLRSDYAAVTRVVPAEADVYCVSAARSLQQSDKTAFIFTNDSDLLVLDSGATTKVAMLELLERNEGLTGAGIYATIFTPAAIARAAGLTNMVKVAYQMDQDPHITFEAAVIAVKDNRKPKSPEYKAFIADMSSSEPDEPTLPPMLKSLLNRPDPRVSEFAWEVIHARSSDERTEIRVFLPFLIDDPARASVWQCAKPLRQLAYASFLSCGRYGIAEVREFDRKGVRTVPAAIKCSQATLVADTELYTHWLSEQHRALETSGAVRRWRLIAMAVVVEALREQDRLPTLADIEHALTLQIPLSWPLVHLRAQLEAVLYSFRMMQQLIGLTVAESAGGRASESLASSIRELHSHVSSLPSATELFESSIPPDDDVRWSDLVKEYLDLDGLAQAQDDSDTTIGEDSDVHESASDGDDGDDHRRYNENPAALASNPFGLLAG